jgi:5-hydroxyisourate hydrolase
VTSLSTHVLDTERGIPAVGVRVALYRDTRLVAEAATGANGRIADLGGGALDPGTYRLDFDVAAYLLANGRVAPFLEAVTIRFHLDAAEAHYHIPLLITPCACTSYRGA